MVKTNLTLEIDLGPVGYRNEQHPFWLRLTAEPLRSLIDDAHDKALRVYELLLIDRPGDLWNYLFVEAIEVPPRVSAGIERLRTAAERPYAPHPWPAGKIPFLDFDRLFYWCDDDTEPEDQAWLGYRGAGRLNSFVLALLATVREAQRQLSWNDPLLQHIVSKVKDGTHPYCFKDRADIVRPGRVSEPLKLSFTPGFYRKLDELLGDADITSVAFRHEGDTRVLRMLATEQRRRAALTGHRTADALHVGALVDEGGDCNSEWDAEIAFFSEGLSHGDLFIQGSAMCGASIKELVEQRHRIPGRHILSCQHEGDIPGFTLAGEGEGWFAYVRQAPDSRRRALTKGDFHRRSPGGQILAFAEADGAVFAFEKALIVVGASASPALQSRLAAVIAAWEAAGTRPLVLSVAGSAAGTAPGIPSIAVPEGSSEALEYWLRQLLHYQFPWIDVALLFDAPEWLEKALARRFDGIRPWRPWVVSDRVLRTLPVDLCLTGDAANALAEAAARAATMRH